MGYYRLTPKCVESRQRNRDRTLFAWIGLCARLVLGVLGCADDDGVEKIVDPDKACVASEIRAASFRKCTCKGTRSSPGPGTFGCVEPRTVYNRVCMIDSSCNAYAMPDYEADHMAVATLRDDVAFRFEWAEPFPEDANLGVNTPEPDSSALLSPFTFFTVKDPLTYSYDFQEMSSAAESATLMLSEDRKSATLIPNRGCFGGHWYLQVNFDLSLIYGGNICGEPENIHPGYTAYFFIDD